MHIIHNPCTTCQIEIENANVTDLQISDILGRNIATNLVKTTKGYSFMIVNQNTGLYFVRNTKTGQTLQFVKE